MASTNPAASPPVPLSQPLSVGQWDKGRIHPSQRDSSWDSGGTVSFQTVATQWLERQPTRDSAWDTSGTALVRNCPTLFRRMGHLSDEQAEAVIAAELSRPQWSVRDWLAYFEERAGIARFDGGLARFDAECAAYVQCVQRFLVRHPPGYRPDLKCLNFGDMVIRAESTPIVCPDNLQRWVHKACAETYRLQRVADAILCLERLGIIDPVAACELAGAIGKWMGGLSGGSASR